MNNFGPKTTATEAARFYSAQIKGKTILITGVSPLSLGSTLVTVLHAHSPALLVLLSRTTSKIQSVVSTLPPNHSTQIKIVEIDLSSQTSVRLAVKTITTLLEQQKKGIDIIFNNAGINISAHTLSSEGIELQFATNHIGPFLLTNLLLPLILSSIRTAGQKRIVLTSSEAHRISPIRFSDVNLTLSSSQVPEDEQPRRGLPKGFLRNDGGYEPAIAYAQSKTANVLFCVGLNERLLNEENGRGVKSLAVMPGNIMTNLIRDLDSMALEGLKSIHDWKNLDEGVASLIVAAFAPELSDSSTIYVEDSQPKRPSKWAIDKEKAERLWKLSEELVGEKFDFQTGVTAIDMKKSRL